MTRRRTALVSGAMFAAVMVLIGVLGIPAEDRLTWFLFWTPLSVVAATASTYWFYRPKSNLR